MTLTPDTFFLRRDRMLKFLTSLETTPEAIARSIYMPPEMPEEAIDTLLKRVLDDDPVPEELVTLASRSATGAAIFWGSGSKYLISPPFPFAEKHVFGGYVSEPFRLLLQSDWTIGVVIVHLGTYAVACCQGERIITSKTGTGLVHGRHKKGGSSQQRFQRRRENQAREFLERVCLHAREQLEPRARLLDYVAFGGPRHTVLALKKQCPFLSSLEGCVLPLVDVPWPKSEMLPKAVVRIWSSRVTGWH
jgi:hypothetical protein